jgi:hypothetical protein
MSKIATLRRDGKRPGNWTLCWGQSRKWRKAQRKADNLLRPIDQALASMPRSEAVRLIGCLMARLGQREFWTERAAWSARQQHIDKMLPKADRGKARFEWTTPATADL